MGPLGVAIVGAGNIARVHAKALAAVTEAGGPASSALVAVMDVDDSQLRSFGAEFEVRETYAVARTQARTMPTEDVSLAHVTFASGAVASVVNSVLSPREETYLRFDFERATVEVTHLYGYGDDDWRVTPE